MTLSEAVSDLVARVTALEEWLKSPGGPQTKATTMNQRPTTLVVCGNCGCGVPLRLAVMVRKKHWCHMCAAKLIEELEQAVGLTVVDYTASVDDPAAGGSI